MNNNNDQNYTENNNMMPGSGTNQMHNMNNMGNNFQNYTANNNGMMPGSGTNQTYNMNNMSNNFNINNQNNQNYMANNNNMMFVLGNQTYNMNNMSNNFQNYMANNNNMMFVLGNQMCNMNNMGFNINNQGNNNPANITKQDFLQELANNVNETKSLEQAKDNALVLMSDVEGRPTALLKKLKQAGVINEVEVKEDGALDVKLNENFHGTIAYCGDLTAYKFNNGTPVFDFPYGNTVMSEVFQELLKKIKTHNEVKTDKQKQIQFVAVPGNHEFISFSGTFDLGVLGGSNIDFNRKDALLDKLKALKAVVDVQLYYLEQIISNKQEDNIIDDDYADNKNCNNYKEQLEAEATTLLSLINEIEGTDDLTDIIRQELENMVGYGEIADYEKQDKYVAEHNFTKLAPLNWYQSKLLPKIVFCHNGKKYRILHSFSLFMPVEYNRQLIDNEKYNFKKDQKKIFSNAFANNSVKHYGIGYREHPEKELFSQNDIPTFVGHEGVSEIGKQTEKVYCVDKSGEVPYGAVFIVGDDGYIDGYATATGEGLNNEQFTEGELLAHCPLATYWLSENLLAQIKSYINNNNNDIYELDTVRDAVEKIVKRKYRNGIDFLENLNHCITTTVREKKEWQIYRLFRDYQCLEEDKKNESQLYHTKTNSTEYKKPILVGLSDIDCFHCDDCGCCL